MILGENTELDGGRRRRRKTRGRKTKRRMTCKVARRTYKKSCKGGRRKRRKVSSHKMPKHH